ncbi:MAG: acyl carrier protein [Eubacteriales bacterium]|nr:acyl carrier protein [Eubacteriales bacterium]
MLEKMKTILAEMADISESEITLDTSFKDDLDLDSLDLFELLTNLEEEYGIQINAEDMADLTTVGMVVDYLTDLGIKA